MYIIHRLDLWGQWHNDTCDERLVYSAQRTLTVTESQWLVPGTSMEEGW